ncbi:hypothetical protein [Citrobacter portucalensis]|jgi:alpha-beta hydrolase superfamily lysophospholipase|uniref:hypothetical protein n=1 Tax=Citrobacter portucalensis TaxID=1639133 RepID=UPI001EDA5610|nr:hypothetical protein [Citrobacter portucalensis]MCC2946061.1 hypothetical protein [Citrobacter freundii]UKK91366.1 hypothetical protein L6310_25200 [Citrobacter portucalensis]
MPKTHAYVEHRPKASDKSAGTTYHVVIVNGAVEHTTNTQEEAADWAIEQGYVVHVARERHLQDRDQPAHWREY